MAKTLNDEYKTRLNKLKKIREQGIDPYPNKFDKKENLATAKKMKSGSKVKVAGRIMTMRLMGKIAFCHLQDFSAKMQVVLKVGEINKNDFKIFTKNIDLGDIIGVEGEIFSTQKGEISVLVKKYQLLAKALRPLPEKWHGLKDKEIRYRQRYLDLIMNPEVRDVFIIRSKIIDAMRKFMLERGYFEVETPILQPIYGGASARPFVSELNALNMKVYLRIADELYLKRLLVGGFEKIFEFSIDFRNEGIDRAHNPEFLLFEAMTAYDDYQDGMKLIEELTEHVVKEIHGKTKINYQGQTIDFKTPWQRISVREAIKKYAKIDIEKANDQKLKKIVADHKLKIKGKFNRGSAILALIEEFCEKHFIQPTFLYDYPTETSTLAKSKTAAPQYVERFEQYINGFELGNNYSELNDPQLLAENWKKQEAILKKGDKEAQKMDKDFIKALEVGMPPACGLGIGIDRLTMLLTDSPSIRDVILFPFMRPEK
jgi:lysyl-tRNA synthetase class 2